MTVLVTGAAGFIGYHAPPALAGRGETVIGIDNLERLLRRARSRRRAWRRSRRCKAFTFREMSIADQGADGRAARAAIPASTAWCIWPRRPACATR